MRRKLTTALVGDDDDDEAPKRRVHRVWLGIERVGAVLGAFASLVAILGIWSYISEADDRRIDHSIKVYEATTGAMATIDQSRGKVEEIGQSDAVALISYLGRPVESLDLTDVVLRGASLTSPLVQPPGGLVVLDAFALAPGKPVAEQYPNLACKARRLVAVDWILLNRSALGAEPVCLLGSFMADQLAASGAQVVHNPPSVDFAQVRSRQIADRTADYAKQQQGESEGRAGRVILALPTLLSLNNSDLSAATFGSTAEIARISYTAMPRARLTLDALSISIGASDLRGAAITAPTLTGFHEEQEHRRTCAARASGRAPTTEAERSAAMRCIIDTARASTPSALSFPSSPLGLTIVGSDIRGADLSKVPARYLKLVAVCADKTTRLPGGVAVAACDAKALAHWDRVEGCGADPLAVAVSAECRDLRAKRTATAAVAFAGPSQSAPNLVASGAALGTPDPIAAYEAIMTRYAAGRDHVPRSGRSREVLNVIEPTTAVREPTGGGNWQGEGFPKSEK